MFKQEWLSAALAALEVSPDIAMVYPKYATYIDSGGRYFEEGIYAGAHSCSEIDTAGIEDPIARATHVIKSLGMCTNFHGLFRTDIAKHLPLKSVLAFDVLVLATATLYGHIRSVSVEGIQRRVVRARESNDERHDRYTSVGLALRADKLIGLHLWYAVLSMQGGVASWVRHGAEFKDALEFKFGTHSPHMQFLKAIKDRPNFIGIPFLLYRFVRSPTSLLHRPTLGALKSRLRGNA